MQKGILFCCLLALAGLYACSKTDTLSVGNTSDIITFSLPTTRAAINSGTDLNQKGNSFAVWGNCRPTGSYRQEERSEIFTGHPVAYNGGRWYYTGEIRYWYPEYTYDFYAIYPFSLPQGASVAVDASGMITVADFDCSATGEHAVDLMTACQTGIAYGKGDIPRPVRMNFRHELTRLNFMVQTEEGTVCVVKASLIGIDYKGTLKRAGETVVWESLTTVPEGVFERTTEMEVDLKGMTLLNEMLLPPQKIESGKAFLSVVYRYSAFDEEHSKTVALPAVTWEAGKNYTYVLTIESDGRIHFEEPAVNHWDDALGGIIIVD